MIKKVYLIISLLFCLLILFNIASINLTANADNLDVQETLSNSSQTSSSARAMYLFE